ncbi:MAG: hypothetical protein OM95_07900 [Bdellovibrio sp. ArHS]|uniref:hypothetical protein n=1 Tax=Bdellovibrio sp. ArHS TaxID=1569284 RepID=UPI0005824EB9|nr:hypothetical protein [Bdellovibrio sp. ArHS]KHD88712.1 MAG: hypothetical protein OM95_07900 [Bdellovibrio sp. ArHS]
MEKINRYIINFLKYGFPIVLIAVALDRWGYNSNREKVLSDFVFDLVGWMTVAWFVAVVYLFFAIAFNEKLKNSFVRRLAGIKENDERESYLTGGGQ